MMSHDQMMNGGSYHNGYNGLYYFGGQILRDAAGVAARAVYETCDGATDWKSWVHPSGQMVKLSLEVMSKFLDQQPDASAEALYIYLMRFPGGEKLPQHNIWAKHRRIAWSDTPLSVRAAYEAFRAVYLQMWVIARTHNENMAKALPPRPAPKLVHSSPMDRHPAGKDGRMGGLHRLDRDVVQQPLGQASEPQTESDAPKGDGAA
jgi:hypothetical protein